RAGRRAEVATEIAEPLELHRSVAVGRRQGRLELAIAQHLERVRIEVRGEIASVRAWALEQLIVEADLGPNRLPPPHPVQRRLHLAPVGGVAAAGLRIVGAPELDHLAGGVLHDLPAGDEIRVAQPNLLARREPEEALRRHLREILALDIELAAESD